MTSNKSTAFALSRLLTSNKLTALAPSRLLTGDQSTISALLGLYRLRCKQLLLGSSVTRPISSIEILMTGMIPSSENRYLGVPVNGNIVIGKLPDIRMTVKAVNFWEVNRSEDATVVDFARSQQRDSGERRYVSRFQLRRAPARKCCACSIFNRPHIRPNGPREFLLKEEIVCVCCVVATSTGELMRKTQTPLRRRPEFGRKGKDRAADGR